MSLPYSRQLDQFYTQDSIAKECYNQTKAIVPDFNSRFLVEPSAGSGSFSDLFDNPKSLAMDIMPLNDDIIHQDFLLFDYSDLEKENVITIGNPPFGQNASLAIQFFNKSALFSDYIAMILPRTFKKDSVINKLDLNCHLLFEKCLPDYSFIFNNKNYNVPCVFQIWGKTSKKRSKIPQETKSKYFDFVDKQEADIAIRRVGGLAGKIIHDFDSYQKASHYYLKINKYQYDYDKIINHLNNCYCDLNTASRNTSGNPSLSKHELITIFEKIFELG